METVSTLFEDHVPICVRYQEREHNPTLSTIRIDIATKAPAQRKVLHVQITDENDPFFFYSLDVTEEDFQGLKNEQSLKPDFVSFPTKLIELLRSCINCARDASPLYSAELVHQNSQWILQIVKIDDFKNLVPLSLLVRAGNDATIKKYLAGKLSDYRAENTTIQATLAEVRTNLLLRASTAEARVGDLSRALEAKTAEVARVTTEFKAEVSSVSAQEREKSFTAHQEFASKAEDERRALVHKHDAVVAQMTEVTRRLEQDNKELLDAKYRLDADVKDLTSQLHVARVDIVQYKQDTTSLRTENKSISTLVHEHEKDINQQKIKIAALEQQIFDKDELLKKMTALLDATNSQKATLEESIIHMKSSTQEMEDRIGVLRGEIKKGNQIIATLQTALKSSKQKAAQKEESLHRLQDELATKERQMAALHNGEVHAASQRDSLQRDLAHARESEAALARRLEECCQVITNNNNVIEFLQRELLKMKEGSLNTSAATQDLPNGFNAPASSYKFRATYTSPQSVLSSQSPLMSNASAIPYASPTLSATTTTIATPKDTAQTSSVYITPSLSGPTNPSPPSSTNPPISSNTPPPKTPFSVVYNPPTRKGLFK